MVGTNQKDNRKGAVLVLVVILLPVIILLAAFSVNLAYVELNKTEMVIAADAAARAGGREFTVSRSEADARARAKEFAQLNEIAGKALQLADGDIEFGRSTRADTTSRYSFTANAPDANSVKVLARRTSDSSSGRLPLLMPSLFGLSDVEMEVDAVSTQIEVDIALVIDRSGSMAYAANEVAAYPPNPASAPEGWNFCDPVPPNSRWLNVMSAVDVFLQELANSSVSEQVSVSTYSDNVITNQDLTFDYAAAMNSLQQYSASFCSGGTNIGGGINEGAAALMLSPATRPEAAKVIVVLTDGIHNTGSNPNWAASNASDDGVLIFTITFSNEADQNLMRSVADRGNGKHFHATSAADLVDVFREIAVRLPVLITK